MTSTKTDGSLFLREFLRAPTRTAAVAPSGTALADQMALPIPERGEPVVVELGPGTGAFTRAIEQRLAGRGRQLAVELNPTMADHLAARFPGVEVARGRAGDLPQILAGYGIDRADVIVSGLPWFAYEADSDGPPLVHTLASVLTTQGVLTQFAYTWTRWAPPARRLLHGLRAGFEEVVSGRTVWANLPPATVYFARRPRSLP
ncbi:SAM-dependent methyltransferase [Polymorphospora sp. NPDC050346]|uniref:class I SAM-dependent methyltransferase n=1 Tax=Polymorphospora sp. NPDC050346 TaxID=3155780 RepID=UPI0033EBC69E